MKKKVLCTALVAMMLMTTTALATTKPWWLSKYQVTFDNELGIVGNVTLTFASDDGSFIRPITIHYITYCTDFCLNPQIYFGMGTDLPIVRFLVCLLGVGSFRNSPFPYKY